MEPLDLRARPPRSAYAELDGLMLMPRTIDKLRALLPGGHSGGYYISDAKLMGISHYLLHRLGIPEADLLAEVRDAKDEDEVARWLRERVDVSNYAEINQALRRIKPKHTKDPEYFRGLYAETMKAHPELEYIIDIVEADDLRIFPVERSRDQ